MTLQKQAFCERFKTAVQFFKVICPLFPSANSKKDQNCTAACEIIVSGES